MAEPITNYVITPHATSELGRRNISREVVTTVLAAPEQRHTVRQGRDVLPSRMWFDDKAYLVRVFVDVDRVPAEVVTAYRTSRIAKYWS